MKLKKQFITHEVDDTTMLVNTSNEANEFHGLVKLNDTASFIVKLLKEETTEKKILEAMLNYYEVDEATAKEDLKSVLDSLKSIGALE